MKRSGRLGSGGGCEWGDAEGRPDIVVSARGGEI